MFRFVTCLLFTCYNNVKKKNNMLYYKNALYLAFGTNMLNFIFDFDPEGLSIATKISIFQLKT